AKYTDAEVDAIVATHTAITSAHHAKYLDSEAVSAMGVKADANALHHDRYTDPALDDVTDVTITAVAVDEVLAKSAGDWINRTLAEAGIAAASHGSHDHDTPIATHTAITSAHHAKYTDAEAAAKIASDALYMLTGAAPNAHSIASHSDTTATGAELETLTGGTETTLHSHAASGGGDVVYVKSGETFEINNTVYTSIIARSVTGVSVGDTLEIELTGYLHINAGGPRTINYVVEVGGEFNMTSPNKGFTSHASQKAPIRYRMTVAIVSASEANAWGQSDTPGSIGSGGNDWQTNIVNTSWDSTAADLTGTVTVDLRFKSDSGALTQLLEVVSYTIRHNSNT
ncbi:hypothetical protein LCGC14_1303590, partial [marine sediment metagenome]